ncbi:galactose-1-phosphate uridylyltransferase [Candidatus Laterigemmans baculatus]|uniref:galactose-1-phosphate uridylyltransferase n=1 Tax=Candidatus Laterigemmans baculatus TaxID=2770505 RepID=UPI00193C8226|nr:DUF4921 family protein [Candidatus Laterigemmans baculatus]
MGLPFPPSTDPSALGPALSLGDAKASRDSDGGTDTGGDGHPEVARVSQTRRDALTGRWAIFAPGRNSRPAEIGDSALPRQAGHSCPFCGGHEQYTPAPSLVVREPNVPREQWSVRVVPNLYPAVSQDHPVSEAGPLLDEPAEGVAPSEAIFSDEEADHNLFQVTELHGGHEVVIETPNHLESLTDLSQQHAGRVFQAYAARMRYWYDVPGVEYVVTFKNVGAAAGASLRHTHSQVIATSLLPPSVSEIGQRVENHFRRCADCLLCATLLGELEDGRRVVLESKRFVAYCPFASRMPYLVRIAPRHHSDRFETSSAADLEELAGLVQGVLHSLEATFAPCAYNYTIHTRPRNVASPASFHWWMELFPRLTKVAGFEWSSDCFINPVPPELAATHLRREQRGRTKRTVSRKSAEFSD